VNFLIEYIHILYTLMGIHYSEVNTESLFTLPQFIVYYFIRTELLRKLQLGNVNWSTCKMFFSSVKCRILTLKLNRIKTYILLIVVTVPLHIRVIPRFSLCYLFLINLGYLVYSRWLHFFLHAVFIKVLNCLFIIIHLVLNFLA
jgi:hypothetical protein